MNVPLARGGRVRGTERVYRAVKRDDIFEATSRRTYAYHNGPDDVCMLRPGMFARRLSMRLPVAAA